MYPVSPPSEETGLSSHGALNVSERERRSPAQPVKVPIKFQPRTDGDGRAQPPEVVIRAIGYSGGGNRGGNRGGAGSPGLADMRRTMTPSPLSSIGGSAYGGRGLTPEALEELLVPGEEAIGGEEGYPESREEQTQRQLEMHEHEGEGMGRSGDGQDRGAGGGGGGDAGGQPQYQPRRSPARPGQYQHPVPHEQQYQPQPQPQPQPQLQPPQPPQPHQRPPQQQQQQHRSYPPPQEQPYATTPQSQAQLHPQQQAQSQQQQQQQQHSPRYPQASPPQQLPPQQLLPYGHDSRAQSVMQRRGDLWDRTQQNVAAGIAQRGAATALGGGVGGVGGVGANFGGGGGSIASGGESARNPLVMVLLEEVWSRVQDWEARLGQAEEGVGDAAGLAYMHVGQLVTQAKVRSTQWSANVRSTRGRVTFVVNLRDFS